MGRHATEPMITSFTSAVARALAMANVARDQGRALAAVAPTTRVRDAVTAVDELVEAAERAAAAAVDLGSTERAVQAQLYPTQGRDVQAAPVDPPLCEARR